VNQARTDYGCTPLYIAACQGNLDMVRYLAGEAHADVNQATADNGYTPLFIATHRSNHDVVRYLVCESNADVDQGRIDEVSAREPMDLNVGNESVDQEHANVYQIRSSDRTDSMDTSLHPGYDGTKHATSLAGSSALTMPTQYGQDERSRHRSAPRLRRDSRFLRLLQLVGILLREEHRQAKNPDEIHNSQLQDRVARFKRALSHNEIPSTKQMRAAVLRLVGGNSSMREKTKSRLTLAYRTYFMLQKAALRRR